MEVAVVVSIQLLRALSAISILIYHVLVNQFGEIPSVHVLRAGVDIFFVISGYIIARSTEAAIDPGHFLARRFIRIYPVWWAALGLWLLGSRLILDESAPLSEIIGSFALIFTWNDQHQDFAPTYHIGWSLCYEVIFYTLWALSINVAASRARVKPLVVAVGLIVGMVTCVWIILKVAPSAQGLRPYGSSLMLVFLAGAVIRQAEKNGLLVAANRAFGRWDRWAYAGGATFGFGLIALGLLPARVSAVFAVLTFLAFLSIRIDASSVVGRLGVYLGDASYSLYLFHALLLDLAFVHTGILICNEHSLINAVVAFAACFAFSLAMYHLIEKPCVVLGRRLTSSWRHPLRKTPSQPTQDRC